MYALHFDNQLAILSDMRLDYDSKYWVYLTRKLGTEITCPIKSKRQLKESFYFAVSLLPGLLLVLHLNLMDYRINHIMLDMFEPSIESGRIWPPLHVQSDIKFRLQDDKRICFEK